MEFRVTLVESSLFFSMKWNTILAEEEEEEEGGGRHPLTIEKFRHRQTVKDSRLQQAEKKAAADGNAALQAGRRSRGINAALS